MSINPRENLFAQLPQNVRNLIGYFVVIDFLKEQESNPQKKPLIENEDPLIEEKLLYSPMYLMYCIANENKALNLVKQGWDYNGIIPNPNSKKQFLLRKQSYYRRYGNRLIIRLNHHEIFYSTANAPNKNICVFKQQPSSPSIDNLLRINSFIHPDSFEFLNYFPYAHAIAIRLLNNENQTSNNIILIPLPGSTQATPFLEDYFYRTAVCKRLLIEGGQE
jgi:hypothetical protein